MSLSKLSYDGRDEKVRICKREKRKQKNISDSEDMELDTGQGNAASGRERNVLPEGKACKEKTKKPTKADIRWAITHIFDILFNSFNMIDAFR